ncbi:hypothetical protein AAHE18_09G247500 [Arachis hypogaea]
MPFFLLGFSSLRQLRFLQCCGDEDFGERQSSGGYKPQHFDSRRHRFLCFCLV